jgi:hypothetical protein
MSAARPGQPVSMAVALEEIAMQIGYVSRTITGHVCWGSRLLLFQFNHFHSL